MSNTIPEKKFSLNKTFWPLYILGGFQSISYGSLIVLVVPLSFLFWPSEAYHALEMGLLMMNLFWFSSLGGIFFGWLIDKSSRVKLLFYISLFRGFSMIMLGFAIEALGFTTWLYFLIFIIIFAFFAGGSWPGIISLSNDSIPKSYRSRFFGIFGVVMGIFSSFGFLIASAFIQFGYWRLFFWIIGIGIILGGLFVLLMLNEPKRGSQQEELLHVLKDEKIIYDFKIDMKLMKETMLSKTNLVALIEGISTNILLGSVHFLVLPYLQTEPHNLSPLFTGLFIVLFGLTGGAIGQIFLAKFSDKLAEHHPIRRIYFVIIALSVGMTTFTLVFFIDLPHLTIEQGNNIPLLLSNPIVWSVGILYFISQTISSLYMVNQVPIIQDINLPEAQGKITAANQLLENIGHGIGPLLVGILLTISAQNYQITIVFILLFIIPGVLLWFLALKWYQNDRMNIKSILTERSEKLQLKPKNDQIPLHNS